MGSSHYLKAMSTFSYGRDFMMGLGKPKLYAKFKVASFSDCVNIEGGPQILGSSPSLWRVATLTLSSACNFMMGLGKPKLYAKLEVASFSRCRNIKGEATNFGDLL